MNWIFEVWKPIIGFGNCYEISDHGNVRRVLSKRSKRKYRYLKHQLNELGYAKVYLYHGGNNGRKMFYIHQLVAQYFLENPHHHTIVNHIDENPVNNHVDNLEWCTQKYNVNYGTANKRRSCTLGTAINQYTLNGVFVEQYPSVNDAAKTLSISDSTLQYALLHSHQSHGYLWKIAWSMQLLF